MEQLSTDDLRRRQPKALRRVLAGESFELTTYGSPIGVCVVPKSWVDEIGKRADVLHGLETEDGDGRWRLAASELREVAYRLAMPAEGS